MAKVWDLVCFNLVWNVGDGCSIDFWLESWVGDLGLMVLRRNDVDTVQVCHTQVAAMVALVGGWAWTKFQDFLPSTVLLSIVAVKPPSTVVPNTIGWSGDSRCVFTNFLPLPRAGDFPPMLRA
ncbi:hypothetical protein V6N13_030058 [Hibiscus sabdariffa]